MVHLRIPDDDLFVLSLRVLRQNGIRNLQEDFIDRHGLTITFTDTDEALKAQEILKKWRIDAVIPEAVQ